MTLQLTEEAKAIIRQEIQEVLGRMPISPQVEQRIETTAKRLVETLVPKAKGGEEAVQELEMWKVGKRHLTPEAALQVLSACPDCKPGLEQILAQERAKAVGNLSKEETRAAAERHGFWPPKPVSISLP